MDFYTIMTNGGKQKIIDANTNGKKLDLERICLGDGNGYYYAPSPTQTSLKNEVWRGNITNISKSVNPSWIKLETTIPSTAGGFYIREIGILDSDNTLIAIGKYPETYKPVLADGSIKELYINVIIEVSDVSVINISLDSNITSATKKDLQDLDTKVSKDLDTLKQQLGDISDKELKQLEKELNSKINLNTAKIHNLENRVDKIDVDIALLKGQGASNIFLEKFENLNDINLISGIWDKKNKRVVI